MQNELVRSVTEYNHHNLHHNGHMNMITPKKESGFHKITCKGVCVEYTRNPSEAASTFKNATTPKEWWVVRNDGSAILMNRG